MRTMTITIDNVPEGVYNSIWDGAITTGPKEIRNMQPVENIKLDYGKQPTVAKHRICEALVILGCTLAFEELRKLRGS